MNIISCILLLIPIQEFGITNNISSGLLLILPDLIEVPLCPFMAIVESDLINLITLNLFGHSVEKIFKVSIP